ncbi:hypothetical protein ABT294_50030 [Nonomuraea sp. NPDC000554]|uniref:hypothetical protein n=1 Tax=Nonomuraea sp. NPDC000554 TaxID=3154259 RepID=UPI0033221405
MTVMDDGFELEEELRAIAELLDPVPPELFEHAMQAFTLRTLDAELAELTFDSSDAEPATRVRGAAQPRMLTFEGGGVVLELELTDAAGGTRMVGRLLNGGPTEIGVQRREGVARMRSDDLGRFTAESLARGPLRLRVTPDGGDTVVTSWILI